MCNWKAKSTVLSTYFLPSWQINMTCSSSAKSSSTCCYSTRPPSSCSWPPSPYSPSCSWDGRPSLSCILAKCIFECDAGRKTFPRRTIREKWGNGGFQKSQFQWWDHLLGKSRTACPLFSRRILRGVKVTLPPSLVWDAGPVLHRPGLVDAPGRLWRERRRLHDVIGRLHRRYYVGN